MTFKGAARLDHVGEYYFSRKLEQIRQMRAAGLHVINLGIGSPDLEPSAATIQAAQEALKLSHNHGYSSYRATPELRTAIAQWYLQTYEVTLDPERSILPLLGSKEALLHIGLAFLNPGDQVLVPNPGYPAYSSATYLAGGEVRPYDLTEENDWQPDFTELEKQDLSRVKLMWVNYPHMPTGARGSAELFQRLLAFGERHGILICHDNPYSQVLNSQSPQSILRFDPGCTNSLELNSFSKSFNMAGWRVGMLCAHPEVIDLVVRVKSNVDSGMFIPVQMGAIQALQNSASWHAERNAIYSERRALVFKIFDCLGFTYQADQVGLFVWAKAPASLANVESFIDEVLVRAQVFITPGFIFGTNGERFARASLCASHEQLAFALERLQKLRSAP